MFTLAGWKKTASDNYIVYASGHAPREGQVHSITKLPADMELRLLKFKRNRGTYSHWGGGNTGVEMYQLLTTHINLLAKLGITTISQLVVEYQNDPTRVTRAASKNRCSTGDTIFKNFMDELVKNAKHLTDPDWTPPVVITLGLDTITVKSLPKELNPSNYDASVMAEVRKNLKAKVIDLLEPILADAVETALKAKEARAKADLKKVRALKS